MIRQNPLPEEERAFLASLQEDPSSSSPTFFRLRLFLLFSKGWSLSTLGDSFSPPLPRATIHYWVRSVTKLPTPDPTRTHPVYTTPLPPPTYPSSPVSSLTASSSTSIRSISPDVPEQFVTLLPRLSQEARRYRSGMSPTSRFAVANQQFTEICKQLHALGVPSQKIADLTGVSYRAIARRVAK